MSLKLLTLQHRKEKENAQTCKKWNPNEEKLFNLAFFSFLNERVKIQK